MSQLTAKKLFLLDGLGAVLSAFLLGIVLPYFEYLIGIPIKVLYFLALLPIFFAVYDIVCYYWVSRNWKPYLKIIAIANTAYCITSIGLLIQHYNSLTNIGLLYFVGEVIIILILVFFEFKTAI